MFTGRKLIVPWGGAMLSRTRRRPWARHVLIARFGKPEYPAMEFELYCDCSVVHRASCG
jgi:hypothetical protein